MTIATSIAADRTTTVTSMRRMNGIAGGVVCGVGTGFFVNVRLTKAEVPLTLKSAGLGDGEYPGNEAMAE